MSDQSAGSVVESAGRPVPSEDATTIAKNQGARGVGATLSEPEIVAAALRVVRTDGVRNLSMRRLSRELGVSPMAAYYYVTDKRELLDLVATAALSDIHVPPADFGPWQRRLRELIDRIDTQLRLYPGLSALLNEQTIQRQVDLSAAIMDILADAGFSEQNILAGYGLLHTHLFGRERLQGSPTHIPPEVTLPPVVHRALRHLGDRPYIYDFGVETVIAGLETQLVRQRDAS